MNVNGGMLRLDPGVLAQHRNRHGERRRHRRRAPAGQRRHRFRRAAWSRLERHRRRQRRRALHARHRGTATFGAVRTNSDFGQHVSRQRRHVHRHRRQHPPQQRRRRRDFNSGFIVNGGAATVGTIGLGTNNSNGALTVAGGSLTATGTVTIGNQATAGRGGAMRVIGGTFTSTDTVNGMVLARTSGTNANNVASAAFTGGVSTVEKITLGFDATVTAGSATRDRQRRRRSTSAPAASSGTAPARSPARSTSARGRSARRSNWSTSAADHAARVAATSPSRRPMRPICRATSRSPACLSGAGGLTKAGLGTLALPAANTFTGPVGVNAGVLRVDGSLAPGDPVSVNGGGILAGTGTVNRAVLLGAGGIIRPGSASPGSTLTAATLTWNGGGALAIDLASGNRLAVAGALNRGSGGALHVELAASAPLAVGSVVTLATFASTDAVPGDFTYSGLPDCRGVFIVGPTSLRSSSPAPDRRPRTPTGPIRRACRRISRARRTIRTTTASSTCSSSSSPAIRSRPTCPGSSRLRSSSMASGSRRSPSFDGSISAA